MLRLTPFDLMVRAIVLLTSIPVHESAHAYVAYKLGDPTAKNMGRISLNPMAHFDLTGSVCMILFGIGWAKPVPINRMYFRDRKKGMAISAAAGPASNLLIALASLVLAKLFTYLSVATGMRMLVYAYQIFLDMCIINISLAIFNLMPFPPFDGSRIFNYFMSDKIYFKIMEYEQYIFIVVLAFLWLGVFDAPLRFLTNSIYRSMYYITYFVDIVLRNILF